MSSALTELQNWDVSSSGEKLTWLTLAKRLGVSRQALCNKTEIKTAFEETKARRAKGPLDLSNPKAVVRRTLEQRLAELSKELEQLRRERDGWIRRWVQVEYNARLHGMDTDLLFKPIEKPLREQPWSGKARK